MGEGLAEGVASDERQKESTSSSSSVPSDGIEGLFDGCELRFGRDKRLEEVHPSVNHLCSKIRACLHAQPHIHKRKVYNLRWQKAERDAWYKGCYQRAPRSWKC